MLLSCVNCSFNPLLADGIGTGDGYCATHRVVLHQPRSLTCGSLLRKDLTLPDAEREQKLHARTFSPDQVSTLRDAKADARRIGVVDRTCCRSSPISALTISATKLCRSRGSGSWRSGRW